MRRVSFPHFIGICSNATINWLPQLQRNQFNSNLNRCAMINTYYVVLHVVNAVDIERPIWKSLKLIYSVRCTDMIPNAEFHLCWVQMSTDERRAKRINSITQRLGISRLRNEKSTKTEYMREMGRGRSAESIRIHGHNCSLMFCRSCEQCAQMTWRWLMHMP